MWNFSLQKSNSGLFKYFCVLIERGKEKVPKYQASSGMLKIIDIG
jgi:hypothetical protein